MISVGPRSRIVCNPQVSINGSGSIPEETVEMLKTSSGVVQRYAQAKDINVEFYPLSIYDFKVVTSSVYEPYKFDMGFLPFKETDDKPLLRKIYEEIQLQTEGTKPRIEKMMSDTLERLRKIGKIK